MAAGQGDWPAGCSRTVGLRAGGGGLSSAGWSRGWAVCEMEIEVVSASDELAMESDVQPGCFT